MDRVQPLPDCDAASPTRGGRGQRDAHGDLAAPDGPAAVEIAARFGRYDIDLVASTASWSPGVAAIFGRPMPPGGTLALDEHLGCYHPDDLAASRAALVSAMAGPYAGGAYRNPGRVLLPDGSVRHVVAKGIGRADAAGRLVATSGLLVDVTDAVEAEQRAQDNGRRLQATLDAMEQGIVMVGADLRISVLNERVKHVLGLPDHLARPGVAFAEVMRFQEEEGEFEGLAEADRRLLPIASAEANARDFTRRRPNGTVLEIRTAPLAGGGFVRTYSDVTERHRREAALALSEQRFRLLAESSSDAIVLCDATMRRLYVSPAITALLGYRPEELLGQRPTDTVHPDDVAGYAAEIAAMVGNPEGTGRTRKRYRRKDGSYVWIELSVSPVHASPPCPPAGGPLGGAGAGSAGQTAGFVAVMRDASAQVEAEEGLRLKEQRLAFALESGGDGVWSYDCARDRVVLEGGWWAILGFAPAEVVPTAAGWQALTHPDDRARVRQAMIDHLRGRTGAVEIEYRIRSKSGGYVWTLARGRVAERSPDGRATLLIGTHQDITRRKRQEQTIARMALHDALTGLPNRLHLRELLERAGAEARRTGRHLAVLACDLDRFKLVNDTLGHAAGDELLRLLAARLGAAVPAPGTVARVGGDEFTVLLDADRVEGIEGIEGLAAAVARRIIAAVEEPAIVAGREVAVGVSIGIAFARRGDEAVDALCRRADAAMYAAKSAGRSTYRLHRPEMDRLSA